MTEESRRCLYFNFCGKEEIKEGRRWKEHWHIHPKGYLCKNHYKTLIQTPRTTTEQYRLWNRNKTPEHRKKYNQIYSPRRIWFLGESIMLSFEPRKGYCNWCPNNIYDKSTYQTEMHHIAYYRIFPWFATVELCSSCHTSKTKKGKRVIIR
jgi:hypothetical protein